MGFLSYNLEYYKKAIYELENTAASKEKVYYAKQLLKFIMDIEDEGYHDLPDLIRKEINGIERLSKYIIQNNDQPFPIKLEKELDFTLKYSEDEFELNECLNGILNDKNNNELIDNSNKTKKEFIHELIEYSNWIGVEEDTTYIFLLRDTLMQYLYYKRKKVSNCVPWLIGRKMINEITKEEDADDIYIRSVINAAQDENITNYKDFYDYCTKEIRKKLEKIPEFKKSILELLSQIKTKKIMVVESGYYGTFPMLLASLDNRVDFKMFTTVPQLVSIYKDKIYSFAYEKNRWFETLYSQDSLIQYSSFHNGKFYVKKCLDPEIIDESMREINEILEK